MFDYTQLKTYNYISKNYFWGDNYDLEEFMGYTVMEYESLLTSTESLKNILRDSNRLERKILCEAENLFKEVVEDDFTYIQNFLNAIYRIYVNKLDNRIFKLYKNKEAREYFYYNLYYKEIELKNIDSLKVIQFFIDNFKLDFGNNGSATNFINGLLKHTKNLKVQRL